MSLYVTDTVPAPTRTSGGVFNFALKSGSNDPHGSLFYYLRDGKVSARHRFMEVKPPDRQQQFGFSLGGPIRRNKAFFDARTVGYGQVFHQASCDSGATWMPLGPRKASREPSGEISGRSTFPCESSRTLPRAALRAIATASPR